ncbi:MAG: cobalamin-independent methionine synthase II family protein [Thaumarchaeota archaeon]|nr:cobalamin-independent methionine synthase II family protein [Nitrososphaerota archaeon]
MGENELFPTSVVGSLPRPEWLIDGIEQHERGELTDSQLISYYDDAVRLAIKEQELTGLDEISDGEQRRFSFLAFVAERISSFRMISATELMTPEARKFVDDMNLPIGIISNPVIVGKINRTAPLVADEITFAKRYTDKKVKAPIIGPFTLLINSWNKVKSGPFYPTPEAAFNDLTRMLREEIMALREAGASFVQLDEPAIGNFVDYRYTRWLMALNQWRATDMEELRKISVELINKTIKGLRGIKVGVHICRGNWPADEAHLSHGGYENMIDEILEMNADQLVLEYATKRAGNFDVFKEHPWEGEVGLGIIDVKNPRIETAQEIVSRVRKASKAFEFDKITLNPDCGFASGRPWPVVSRHVAYAKLRSQTDAAQMLRKMYN